MKVTSILIIPQIRRIDAPILVAACGTMVLARVVSGMRIVTDSRRRCSTWTGFTATRKAENLEEKTDSMELEQSLTAC